MAKQLNASPTKDSISNLVGKIKRKELVLQPEFQRKFVWTPKHMESFIKTILDGYPFPEVYLSQKGIDFETLTTQNVVVDGQQRLTTIMAYIDGFGTFEKNIPKFHDLSDSDKVDFLNYDVIIRDLKDTDKDVIIDIFNRINSTKFVLNSIEINNALYDGEFISTAKNILSDLADNKFRFEILSDTEINRMADLQFILLVMSTLEEDGYFTGNNEIEKYISSYNDEYLNSDLMKSTLVSKLLEISNSDLAIDTIWFRKSNFFTLLVETVKNNVSINNNLVNLNKFSEDVLLNKKENVETNEYSKYYSNMYSGTNSRQARVIRGELFNKFIIQ
jgi:hypothetical protein